MLLVRSVHREKYTNTGELSNKEELDLNTVSPTKSIDEVFKARRHRQAKYIEQWQNIKRNIYSTFNIQRTMLRDTSTRGD